MHGTAMVGACSDIEQKEPLHVYVDIYCIYTLGF